MRKMSLLACLLICLTSATVLAQEQSSNPKTTTEPSATDTPQVKNAVDRMLDEAKEHGELILGSCLADDCQGIANTEGVEAGRAIELVKPDYPAIARAANASGTVEVKVIIGLDGSVIAAAAISGHPLLQAAAVKAARNTRFTPSKYNGEPVKVVGVMQYNFVSQ
jgi:TonB family protein